MKLGGKVSVSKKNNQLRVLVHEDSEQQCHRINLTWQMIGRTCVQALRLLAASSGKEREFTRKSLPKNLASKS